ncbi:MAG: glutamate synthase [Gemmatimonadota bacterium]
MAHLAPYPLAALARRMLRELEQREAIFDLPARKFVRGDPRRDLSVRFHGHTAATPFGPAAGPNTQLAQNIVLSWLAGGRVLELKTVQVNDRLTIPRPCIDMQTVGYNVEWSQELTLEESLEEYAKAAMLIRILEASGVLGLAPGMERTVFDLSVGYDLAGIRSERVQAFIRGMMDAAPTIERLRCELPAEIGLLRDLDFPDRISGTVTLSTFHGCPPREIEGIAEFLMRDLGLACVVKLNPTLLGPGALRELLHEQLGYTDVAVPDDAFAKDTTWEQAVDFLGRLADVAASLGVGFGVKLTNTLIALNHRSVFPPSERVMYLSGPPLHVLAMHLVRRVRRTFGDRISISFSAGVERANFANAVALGLVPVTACTDLLKTGGYGRPFGYFEELGRRMDAVGAATIDEFIVRAYGPAGDAAAGPASGQAGGVPPTSEEVAAAALRNTERYVEGLASDPRYAAPRNRKTPRKIGRRLQLFDCLTCDKCIPVCPNDANFTFVLPSSAEVPVTERRQIATFADFCNDCGNCDTFCPEDGGPYLLKPRIFVSRERWLRDAPRDAILVEPGAITGRFAGVEYWVADGAGAAGAEPVGPAQPGGAAQQSAAAARYHHILRRLKDALLAPSEVNYVTEVL